MSDNPKCPTSRKSILVFVIRVKTLNIFTFFESGKNKAAKGEGWAPPFICCAQDTLGL